MRKEFAKAPFGALMLHSVVANRSRRAGGALARRMRSGGVLGLALAAALALAACGSSDGGDATAASGASGATGTTAGACTKVARPQPRGPQHVPAPRGKLDPAKRYVVTLATNCGAIEIELAVEQAPRTAASFAYLVRRGFYNDLTFHRVAANFVIQGGDPYGNGSGGPGYTVVEAPPADLRYTLGTVAMAKTPTDPSGASGSQFFIVTTANAQLPAQYALLGHVVGSYSGVDTIAKLPTSPAQDGEPLQPVVIKSATLSVSG